MWFFQMSGFPGERAAGKQQFIHKNPSSRLRIATGAAIAVAISAQIASAQVATLNDQAPNGFNSDFNSSPIASGTIPNVGTGNGPGGWNTAQFDFDFSLLGSATWSGGVEFQEQDGVQQIWSQPVGTAFQTSAASYTLDFTRGVGGLTLFHGGLDNEDTVRVTAFYQGVPVALPPSYFDSFTGDVAIVNSTTNSVDLVGPLGGSADERQREYRVTFPANVLVDEVNFVVGKLNGRTGTVTLAHYLFDWLPLTINAEDDIGPTVSNALASANILNVLADNGNSVDTLDDPNTATADAATPATVTVSATDPLPVGITLDASGNISVAAGTAPTTYSIPYEICEIANPTNCASATAFFEVTQQQPPVASPDSDTNLPLGVVATINPLTNDSDTDGLLVAASVLLTTTGTPPGSVLSADGKTLTVPNEGVWMVDEITGVVSFMLASGFQGDPTPVSYTVEDDDGNLSDEALITLDFQDPPVANDDTIVSGLIAPASINPLTNDTDADSGDILDPTTVVLTAANAPAGSVLSIDGKTLSVPNEGIWTVNPTTGLITFSPDAALIGDPTSVTYRASDEDGNTSNDAFVSVEFGTPPVATDDPIVSATIQPVSVNPLTNDDDLDGSLVPASVMLTGTGAPAGSVLAADGKTLTVPGEGVWTVNPATGEITFTPDPALVGDPTPAAYTVADDDGNPSNEALVSVDFGEPPVAGDDTVVSGAIGPVTLDPLVNDNDADGVIVPGTVVFTGTVPPSGATVSSDGKTLTVPGEGIWTIDTAGQISFDPDPALVGNPTPVAYTIDDDDGNTSPPATVTLEFGEPPLARDDGIFSALIAPASVNPLTNDTDADGTLNATTVVMTLTGAPAGSILAADGKTLTVPGEGIWTVNTTTGEITFSPDAALIGDPTPASYIVNDNDGNPSNEAIVTVGYGEAPVAINDSETDLPLGVAVTLNPLTNDGDADGTLDPVSVVLTATDAEPGAILSPDGKTLTVPGQGIWSVNTTTGAITFTPANGFQGDPTPVAYTVADNAGNVSNEALVTLAFQDPPVAVNDVIVSPSIAPATINPLTNDSDFDGVLDPTTVVLTGANAPAGSVVSADGKTLTVPGQGVWTVNLTTGEVTFSPDPALVGDPTPAAYTVADDDGNLSNVATIAVTYGDPPVANDDGVVSAAIAPVTLNPVGNDTDTDGTIDPATVVLTTAGAPAGSVLSPNGKTLTVPGEGIWSVNLVTGVTTFTPDAALLGDPTPVDYVVSDNNGNLSNPATLTVGYGDRPLAVNDAQSDLPLGVPATLNPLANDLDADGTLNGASVVLTLTGAPADAVLAADGKTLTVPGQGIWTVNPTSGAITFAPQTGFEDNPTPVAYTVADDVGNISNAATVTLTFQERPVAGNDAQVSPTIAPVTVNPLTNDSDVDGTLVPASVVLTATGAPAGSVLAADGKTLTVPGEGVWTVDLTTGAITFTPDPALVGNPTPATYTVSDDDGNASNEATVTVGFGEPPVAQNDTSDTGIFGQPVTISALLNDSDPDGTLNPRSVAFTDPAALDTNGDGFADTLVAPDEGTWVIDPVTGEVTFTPDSELVGNPTPVSYTVQDNDGNPSNPATLTVTYEDPTQSLVVLKTVDASGVSSPALVGETVRWTITVENDGNVALAGFAPVDTLTDGNDVPLTLSQDVTKVSESIADDDILLVGEIATYEVTYVLEQSAIDSGQLINVAVSEGQPVTPDGTPILTASGFLSTSDDPTDNNNVDSDGDGNPDDPTVLNLSGFDEAALVITKTTSADIVIAGAAVPYALTVTNTAPGIANGLSVRDVLPADLTYVIGSATVDGVAVDASLNGQTITFSNIDVPGDGSVVLGLVARVGPFASGDLVNTAQMFDPVTGQNIGEAATATVQVRPEAVFQCSDVIGKVFDDVNQNGYQDGPFTPNRAVITDQRYLGDKFARPADPSEIVEPGLPAVRLATTDGTIITTDEYGRFSVPCAALPPRIGENFTLKIDVNSLPTGYRMTTENPRTMRLTAGIMTEMNFGASIGRVVDIDLTASAFNGTHQPVDQLVQGLDGLLGQVASAPATLRITYFTNAEAADVARARLDALEEIIQDKWRAIGTGRLSIERTVARLQ